jgi:hypothetical protein
VIYAILKKYLKISQKSLIEFYVEGDKKLEIYIYDNSLNLKQLIKPCAGLS